MERGENITSQWRNLADTTLVRNLANTSLVMQIHVNSDKPCEQYVPLFWSYEGGTFPLWSSSQENHNLILIMRKTSDKPQMRDSLQNLWPGLLRTIKVIKTRKAGNHYSPEEPKEIQWLSEIGTQTGCWKRKRTLRRNSGNLSKVVNNNIINTGSLIIRETGYSWHGNSVLCSHFFCKSKIAL